MNPLEDFSVLILEQCSIQLELFGDWLSAASPRLVASPDKLDSQMDSSVAVACLSLDQLQNKESEIRKFILDANPYCQLVLIVPRESFLTVYEDDYDAVLQRPIFKEELQDAVEERFKRGTYGALLHEFYHLNTELVAFNRAGASADALDDEDRKAITTRYKQVRAKLQKLQACIDNSDIASISQSIARHKRYSSQPADNTGDSTASKYYPKRCPKCKLPWGVDHRNELGAGFDCIGAHVWKCTRCKNIVHGLGDSHRRVSNM